MPKRKTRTETQVITVDWDFITTEPDAEDITCVQLTKGQRRLLSAIIEYQRWPTRWENAPAVNQLTDYVDALEAALLGEVCTVPILDIRMNVCGLEVVYADDPETWVSIADVQRVIDPCQFLDDVSIVDTDAATDAVSLELRRRGNTAANTGNLLQFLNQASNGSDQDSVRFRAFLSANVVGSLVGALQIIVAPGSRVLAYFHNLANMWLNQWDSLIGLVIRQQSGATAESFQVRDSANDPLVKIENSGKLGAWRKGTSATAPVVSAELNARAAAGVTPATGYGPVLDFIGHSSTTANQQLGRVATRWLNPTHAVRQGSIRLQAGDYTGLYTGVEVTAEDGVTALGFHAASPITKRIHTAVTEFEAIEEINATLAAYGLITDSTLVVADEGGGGGFVPTTELVQEIYRDFLEGPYGFAGFEPGDYTQWTLATGFEPGADGFRLFQNFNLGIEFVEVRVSFGYQFNSAFNVFLGMDWAQNSQLIIHEEELGPNEFFTETVWSYPVFTRPETTAPLQFVITDVFDPLVDGTIIVTAIDIVVRGLASLESDNIAIEEDQIPPDRVVRYVDLTDRGVSNLYSWLKASGGDLPPALEFEAQE